ncbi:MAG: hypothetical protein KBD76_09885 [Bacteriovorax sp.]|nr:hypothetical protein [Bacteriovorax sp.]
MEDESLIDEHILRLKKKKERVKTQKSLLLYKEAQSIIGDKFSYELVLAILSSSWKPSSDKQKEEWMKSAPSFRKVSRKQKPKGTPTPQRESSQATTENP